MGLKKENILEVKGTFSANIPQKLAETMGLKKGKYIARILAETNHGKLIVLSEEISDE